MTGEQSYGPYVTVADEFEVSNAGRTATVRKLETRKGERVEIESPSGDETLRVDALGLESLAWQERAVISQYLPEGDEMESLETESDEVACDAEFELMNEYAHVRLRRLRSPEVSVLQIHAPKKRERIQIDASGLGGLARQTHAIFTGFLEQPHGPEDHH
ncbi:hypothetical protein [Natronorubrum sp. FCH18a]|uniref:hypothetical protein n=1 Tax=Natronorubrum sp. FCH18a TaxID=3447018 RepID=UPI003F5147BC